MLLPATRWGFYANLLGMRNVKTSKDLKKIQGIIKKYYYQATGTIDGADDAAQTIFEWWIKNTHSHQPLKFSVLDYLDTKYKKEQSKFAEMLVEQTYDPTEFIVEKNRIKNVISLIDGQIDRAFFVLTYLWGMSLEEIAECFDCSAALVCQRLGLVRKQLIKKLKAQEQNGHRTN